MKKSMLLVEVYIPNVAGEDLIIKRRIASDYYLVEEWLEHNANLWATCPVEVCSDAYCNGTIHVEGHREMTLFMYSTKLMPIKAEREIKNDSKNFDNPQRKPNQCKRQTEYSAL